MKTLNNCVIFKILLILQWNLNDFPKHIIFVKDRVRTIGQEAARLCEIHPEHAAQIQVQII